MTLFGPALSLRGAFVALVAGLLIAACQTAPGSGGPSILPALRPTVTESQDFVKARRPANPDFIPLTAPEQRRAARPLTPAIARQSEVELARTAARQKAVRAQSEVSRRRVLNASPRPPRAN